MGTIKPDVSSFSIPYRIRLRRGLLRWVFRVVFRWASKVRLIGMANIPRQGAYLIAINHVSLYEPPFVVSFWPVAPEVVGAVEVWNRPGQSLLARWYGGIPVHRGQVDRQMLETVITALQSGYPVLIAPEGGRSHQPGMRRAHPGVAYFVERTGVPVVPVGIVGSTDDFLQRALRGQKPTIEMRVGEPFHLPPVEGRGAARREARQKNADQVMARIAALLPPEYRGVYADDGHPATQTKN